MRDFIRVPAMFLVILRKKDGLRNFLKKGSTGNRKLASGAGEQMKAQYSYEEMEQLLEECGFAMQKHLDYKDMTRDYFDEYNRNTPEHQITAPVGVSYVLAVRK